MRHALRPLTFLALLFGPLASVMAQPALYPLSPATLKQIKPLLDAEVAALPARPPAGGPLLSLAVAHAMTGDLDRAAELGERVEELRYASMDHNPLIAAFEFQGAWTNLLSHSLPASQQKLANMERQARAKEGTSDSKRANQLLDDARAALAHHGTAIQAASLFAAGSLQQAFAHAGLLPERGVVSRENVRNSFLRALVLRGAGRLAAELVDTLDPMQGADRHRWWIAQHLAFRREFTLAADIASRIFDDELWRGAKLGLALAYARFGATDKARREVDQVVANRGRPLPAGALASPPTLQGAGPAYKRPKPLERARLLGYYLLGVGRDPVSLHGATALVGLNMADEGDLDGARHVFRALAQSVGAKPDSDESVLLLASVGLRQADLGDRAGAARTLGILDSVVWLMSPTENDPYGRLGDDPRELPRHHRNTSRALYARLTAALRGMEATFEKYRSTGRPPGNNVYCGILVGAAIGGMPYDRVVAMAPAQAPDLRPQGCDDQLLLALAQRGRYEEAADALPPADLASTAGVVVLTARRLAAMSPTPAVVRLREGLVDRCLYKLECARPDVRLPAPWDHLLLMLVLHGEPVERLDAVVGRLLEIGHDLAALGSSPALRAAARRMEPRQMDVFMQAVGRAMTEPVKLRLRAEARAHAGDLAGALGLVRQIQRADIRVDALIGVTAAIWRREHGAALEILSAYSAKDQEYQ